MLVFNLGKAVSGGFNSAISEIDKGGSDAINAIDKEGSKIISDIGSGVVDIGKQIASSDAISQLTSPSKQKMKK